MIVWERERANKQLIDLIRKELDKGEIKEYRRSLLDS